MRGYFERFRHLRDRHGEAPKSKGAAAAIRQARINASVVLGTMTLVMGTLVAHTISGPFADPGELTSASHSAPAPKTADSVKIVSAGAPRDLPCDQQAWPYIDRRCLAGGQTVWRDDGGATDGTASPVERDSKAANTVIPLPAPRPDIRQAVEAVPAAEPDNPAPAQSAAANEERRKPAAAERTRKRVTQRARQSRERIVRRWRERLDDELAYDDLPYYGSSYGSSRRVMGLPPGLF